MDAFEKNIRSFPAQLGHEGFTALSLESLASSRPEGVVIVGMGGSGLPGEILQAVRKEIGLKVPLVLWREYGLPERRNFLHVFVSFSGDTEETISGLADRGRIPTAVLTTGGAMGRIAQGEEIPAVLFPAADLTPRQAIGRMFYGLIQILRAARLIRRDTPTFTNLNSSRSRKRGMQLARRLYGRAISIYADSTSAHLAYIWKVTCNETAKALAFSNVLPEATHNEIEGFAKWGKKCAAVFLVPPDLKPRLKRKFALTEELLAGKGVRTAHIPLWGKTKLEATWRNVILADWTAYFLAKRYRVDPKKVQLLDTLKQLMAS